MALLTGCGDKIAVMTAVLAEWDVEVKTVIHLMVNNTFDRLNSAPNHRYCLISLP
jgi:hypothetical protein